MPERALDLEADDATGPLGGDLEGLHLAEGAGGEVGGPALGECVRRALGVAQGVVRKGHGQRVVHTTLDGGEGASGCADDPVAGERDGGHDVLQCRSG